MSGTGFTADIAGRVVFDPAGDRIGRALFAHSDIPYVSSQTKRRRLTPCR